MSETVELRCPVCGASKDELTSASKSGYLHCRTCGLLFRDSAVSLEDVTKFYGKAGRNPLAEVDHAKRSLHRRVLKRAEKRLGGPGRLLDVGCSSGEFLLVARERGWEVTGVEPVAELVEVAEGRGLDVRQGTLSEQSFEEGSFDLVTHWDVLILVTEPLDELAQVKRLLAERGLWYARLRQHAVLRAVEAIWPITGGLLGMKDPAVYHPLNYEPRTLRRLLAESGLRGEVVCGKLTSGDAYGIARGWLRSLLSAGKILVNVFARVIERLTGGVLLLSPTMEAWARR